MGPSTPQAACPIVKSDRLPGAEERRAGRPARRRFEMELFSVLVLAFHAAAPAFMRVHASMHLLYLLQY